MQPQYQSTTMLQDLRALPRAFWVLVLGVFINRFGSFVYPFLTLFLTRRGLGSAEIGMVMAGYGAGALMASLVGGWFADHFGRRNTIVFGTLANAVSVFLLYFAPDIGMLMVLTCFAGLFGGIYQPAAGALVADVVPEERRLGAYAVLRQAANAGFAFGSAAGGFFVANHTFALFAGDAATTAVYGFIALAALPHGVRQLTKGSDWSEAFGRLRVDRRFWVLFASQFLLALIFSQFASTFALEVKSRDIHIGSLAPEHWYGLLISWNGVMVMLLELPMTRISQHYNARRVMCAGYAMAGLGFALFAFPLGLPGLIIGMSLFTIGEMLAIPMSSTWIAHIAPEHMRGRYIGALGMSWSVAAMTGAGLGLQVFAWNPAVVWLGCGGFGLLAAFIMHSFGNQPAPTELGA